MKRRLLHKALRRPVGNEALIAVGNLIADHAGVDRSQVKAETRLLHDLGMDGDDAAELLQLLEYNFDFDVKSFDYDDFFGSEAQFINPLRLLPSRTAKYLKEKQPLTVGQLADAVERGRWTSIT